MWIDESIFKNEKPKRMMLKWARWIEPSYVGWVLLKDNGEDYEKLNYYGRYMIDISFKSGSGIMDCVAGCYDTLEGATEDYEGIMEKMRHG